MKRLISGILALSLVLCVTACGDEVDNEESSTIDSKSETTTTTIKETTTDIESITTTTEEPTASKVNEEDVDKLLEQMTEELSQPPVDLGGKANYKLDAEYLGDFKFKSINTITFYNKNDIYSNVYLTGLVIKSVGEILGEEYSEYISESEIAMFTDEGELGRITLDENSNIIDENMQDDRFAAAFVSIISFDENNYIINADFNKLKNDYKSLSSDSALFWILQLDCSVYKADNSSIEKGILYINIIGEDDEQYTQECLIKDSEIICMFDGDFLAEHGLKDCAIVGVYES